LSPQEGKLVHFTPGPTDIFTPNTQTAHPFLLTMSQSAVPYTNGHCPGHNASLSSKDDVIHLKFYLHIIGPHQYSFQYDTILYALSALEEGCVDSLETVAVYTGLCSFTVFAACQITRLIRRVILCSCSSPSLYKLIIGLTMKSGTPLFMPFSLWNQSKWEYFIIMGSGMLYWKC